LKFNLDTVIIFVQNLDLLKSFYVDILQFEVVEEFKSEWVLLKAGNCNIGLHKIPEQYLKDKKGTDKFEPNTKIVFEIEEDINHVREYLVGKNVKLNEVKAFANYDFFTCDGEDPEGNIFQLKQRRKY
jgi:catechol-2,3-dioxygenase